MASRVMRRMPLMAGHTCDNSGGLRFSDEAADTEVAHLLEHVAVEILARTAPQRGCRGETAWDFSRDGRGVFRVTVHHRDADAAAAALERAVDVLEEAASQVDGPALKRDDQQ